jgi:N-glycosylase/DNA lyase
VWNILTFCILSSHVSYVSASKAHKIVIDIDFKSVSQQRNVETEIEHALRETGYRFPKTRARYISEAHRILSDRYADIYSLFLTEPDEDTIREYIISAFPGIGMKQASMLLRDLGVCENFCVLDVHILSFLAIYSDIQETTLNRRSYREAENHLRKIASAYSTTVENLDLAIWDTMRKQGDERVLQ